MILMIVFARSQSAYMNIKKLFMSRQENIWRTTEPCIGKVPEDVMLSLCRTSCADPRGRWHAANKREQTQRIPPGPGQLGWPPPGAHRESPFWATARTTFLSSKQGIDVVVLRKPRRLSKIAQLGSMRARPQTCTR